MSPLAKIGACTDCSEAGESASLEGELGRRRIADSGHLPILCWQAMALPPYWSGAKYYNPMHNSTCAHSPLWQTTSCRRASIRKSRKRPRQFLQRWGLPSRTRFGSYSRAWPRKGHCRSPRSCQTPRPLKPSSTLPSCPGRRCHQRVKSGGTLGRFYRRNRTVHVRQLADHDRRGMIYVLRSRGLRLIRAY